MKRLLLIGAGVVLAVLAPHAACAQNDSSALASMSLGSVRTEAEHAAVRLALKYAKQLSVTDAQKNGIGYFAYYSPDIQILTGESDAFNGIIAKVGGTLVKVNKIEVAGVVTPRSDFFHTFPFSAGFESNRRFENVNGIVEVGYVPWFQGVSGIYVKTLSIGLFAQAGYKFSRDSTAAVGQESGSLDQSKEDDHSALARLKASARWHPRIVADSNTGMGLSLVSAADGWLDVVNSEFYHHLEATLRLSLTKEQFFDFTWEKGSGAPNFNRGKQFSANLTILF